MGLFQAFVSQTRKPEGFLGKLLRTKTLGAGGDCCDFHVVKGDG